MTILTLLLCNMHEKGKFQDGGQIFHASWSSPMFAVCFYLCCKFKLDSRLELWKCK